MEDMMAARQTGTKTKGQLDFYKAMQDFKSMFPGMDADVIEAVLRANGGLVDVTVDQLISMASVDGGRPAASRSPPASGGARQTVSRWQPPMLAPLPDDFLRLESISSASPRVSGAPCGGRLNCAGLQERLEENRRQRESLGAEPPPDVAQYLEDERVALLLQNDEFMSELRRNREFMDALEIDTPGFVASRQHGADDYESLEGSKPQPQVRDATGLHPKYHDDEAFKERLKHMGKASRRKFAQMARLFHFSRRGGGARAVLGHGPVPSGDRLLLSDDPLAADDVDSDEPADERAQFEDRHTVQTCPREDGGRSPRDRRHQLV